MLERVNVAPTPQKPLPWNKGKLTGAKPPLRPKHVWSIRTKLQIEGRARDLACSIWQSTVSFEGVMSSPPGRGCRSRRLHGGPRNRATKENWSARQIRIERTDPPSHR